MKIDVDIRPTGIESAVAHDSFDKSIDYLIKRGYRIIDLSLNAELRAYYNVTAYISQHGNWTREGIIHFPKGDSKLVRNSPILYSAKEATKAHRNEKEFYPAQKQIEKSLEDSINFPQEEIRIPTNRFDSEELLVWTFREEKKAKIYGEFLREAGINKMPVYPITKYYVREKKKPFAIQVWFEGLDHLSALDGAWNPWGCPFRSGVRAKQLYFGGGVRGVKGKLFC